jgi:hypothetical protein
MHGVPLLTYALCTEEASDVLRRVALRRPDMLTTGASTATAAATSDTTSDTTAADTKQQGGGAAATLPRAALLWHSSYVYADQVSHSLLVSVCWYCSLC